MRIPSIHRETLHKTLNLPSKLDADFEKEYADVPCYSYPPEWRKPHMPDPFIGKFTVVVKKGQKGERKSSVHRVFVKCQCGRLVPAGRIGQHRCEHWPKA